MSQALTWNELAEEENQPYFNNVMEFVAKERAAGITIYPPDEDLFSAFCTELKAVRVVILGQDPYHGPNQAHGLSFSVKPGEKIPPSLKNIYKELDSDPAISNFTIPKHGYLQKWAEQGVLLLNTVLTVQKGKAKSHANRGWEKFTDKVIKVLSLYSEGIVFLLWGADAHKKTAIIDPKKHHVLKAPHPSPLSAHRGFLGCRHFSTANSLLIDQGKEPIDWYLPEVM